MMSDEPKEHYGETDQETAYRGQERPGSWRGKVFSGWSLFWGAIFLAMVSGMVGGLSL
ncbi:hypothetical protein ACSV9I_04765 [Rhizobium sp. G187]|uniref:hypothetical protein n=1 Tax=Rhizobium sp. G187 TaxID=3451352 RepID=UPI003EE6118D